MIKSVVVVLLLIFGFSYLSGGSGTSSPSPESPEAKVSTATEVRKTSGIPIDKSEKAQAGRKKLIGELISKGIFHKIETPGELPRLWVGPRFASLDFDTKTSFASVVYAYSFDRIQMENLVVLYDGRTGKKIGRYSEYGLKLD